MSKENFDNFLNDSDDDVLNDDTSALIAKHRKRMQAEQQQTDDLVKNLQEKLSLQNKLQKEKDEANEARKRAGQAANDAEISQLKEKMKQMELENEMKMQENLKNAQALQKKLIDSQQNLEKHKNKIEKIKRESVTLADEIQPTAPTAVQNEVFQESPKYPPPIAKPQTLPIVNVPPPRYAVNAPRPTNQGMMQPGAYAVNRPAIQPGVTYGVNQQPGAYAMNRPTIQTYGVNQQPGPYAVNRPAIQTYGVGQQRQPGAFAMNQPMMQPGYGAQPAQPRGFWANLNSQLGNLTGGQQYPQYGQTAYNQPTNATYRPNPVPYRNRF